ncbi:MAG: hypothetical protein ACK5D5_03205, partial [Bacteroidota bacterium]
MATDKVSVKSEKKTKSEGFDLKDLNFVFRIIVRNWYIPIFTGVVAWIIAFLYSYKLIEVYQARAELLLRANTEYYQSAVINEKSYYGNTYQTYIDNTNETRVITSYNTVMETVLRLKERLEVSYFIIGKVKTTEEFDFLPINVSVKNISSGMYHKRFNFRFVDINNYVLGYVNREGKKVEIKNSFNKPVFTPDFVFDITKKISVGNGVVSKMNNLNYQFEINDIESLVSKYTSSIKVENPQYTNSLRIYLSDVIPNRAVIILDTLIEVYSKNTLKSKIDINKNTLRYISRQIDTINNKLKHYQDTIQRYKEAGEILGEIQRQEQDYFADLGKYQNEIDVFKMRIQAMKDLENYIIEDKDPQFLPPSVYLIREDAFLNKAVEDLYNKQLKLNVILLTSTENNFSVTQIKDAINKVKIELLIYLTNSKRAAQN